VWGWLKPIFDSLFSSVITAFTSWLRQEQAEAAKAEARAREAQLNSVREGLQIQADMAKAALEARAPTTGAGWNERLLLLAAGLSLTGCIRFHVYTTPYAPVPPLVPAPLLTDESPFNDREQALADYAVRLRAVVDAVRVYAIEQNERQGYPVSSADAEWLQRRRSR